MTLIRVGVLGALLLIPVVATGVWIGSADARLAEMSAAPSSEPAAAVAAAADESYCNPELKRILRRVLLSCGLMGEGGPGRGCQPVQAKNVATLSGNDFNALFQPMKDRGGIVQFDVDKTELDPTDLQLIDQVFADQRGASWFFVVARASPEGATSHNRDLSKGRAEAVMTHLRETFKDPDLDKEVGLLWLGEEFAQLDDQFCQWRRSADTACKTEDINRSAFVAWIDCQL
jgi:outer membrane protein OmpA-like peptidoglycan-associated protein